MKGATIVRPGRAMLNQRRALVSIRKPRSCHPSRVSGFVQPPDPAVEQAVRTRPNQVIEAQKSLQPKTDVLRDVQLRQGGGVWNSAATRSMNRRTLDAK